MIEKIAKKLNLSSARLRELIDRGIVKEVEGEHPRLFRFDKECGAIENGTAIFVHEKIEIVRGFPKIRRAMMLDPTIKRHFDCPTITIEEKMNGYNVRIASIGGEIFGLTRGGLVCPYTTEKARDIIGDAFFKDNPDLVLCGEMVGPDNPYVPKDIYGTPSLDFFLFDIKKKMSGSSLPIAQRLKLAEEYDIKPVRIFGEYPLDEASAEAREIVEALGRQNHEGIVIKDPQMKIPPIKYTSSQSNCGDLRDGFRFYNDYGRPFFFSRIVREGFQAVEWGESEEELRERCLRLGESILKPMVDTVKSRKRGEQIGENVRIKVKRLETAREFEAHLKRMGIDAVFEKPEKVDGGYMVKIKRLYPSTNDKTMSVLSGELW